MSTWNEEEDGMGFSGLVPSAAEKRAEREEAARIVRENEKLNMAYAEGRKDEREASCVDELVDALKLLIDIESGGHSDGMFRERLYAGMNKARAVLAKLEQS